MPDFVVDIVQETNLIEEDKINQYVDIVRAPQKRVESLKGNGPKTSKNKYSAQIVNEKEKFLLIGDSMMLEGFGPELEHSLLANHYNVVRVGKYSTGLINSSYFDWTKTVNDLVEMHKADVLVGTLGGNDGQAITLSNGTVIKFGTQQWKDSYKTIVDKFFKYISANFTKVYWVGLPIPEDKSIQEQYSLINSIQKEEAKKYDNIQYISIWDLLVKDGGYSMIIKDNNNTPLVVRQGDGIHLTSDGGKIVTSHILDIINSTYKIEEK